jgi:conjugal transfer ATP-binding protein TraC
VKSAAPTAASAVTPGAPRPGEAAWFLRLSGRGAPRAAELFRRRSRRWPVAAALRSSTATESKPPLRHLSELFEFTARDGPENQFASWLPYVAYAPDDKIFVNRDTLGFMVELMPQSGADERMVEILLSLYATCPKGTGIQFSLFASPHLIEPLSRYGTCASRDADQAEKSRTVDPRAAQLVPNAGAMPCAHYLRGSHVSLTQGPTTRCATKLVMSVTVPGGPMTSRGRGLDQLGEGMISCAFGQLPELPGSADDLINRRAVANPHRLMVDRTPAALRYRCRELRDQDRRLRYAAGGASAGLMFSKPVTSARSKRGLTRIRSFSSNPHSGR